MRGFTVYILTQPEITRKMTWVFIEKLRANVLIRGIMDSAAFLQNMAWKQVTVF